MDTQAIIAIVGVGGTLIGSVIGGVVSYFSSRAMRRMDWQLSSAEKEIDKRESLYADFLTEAIGLILLSISNKQNEHFSFSTLVALEARLWFYSQDVANKARKIAGAVMDEFVDKPQKIG